VNNKKVHYSFIGLKYPMCGAAGDDLKLTNRSSEVTCKNCKRRHTERPGPDRKIMDYIFFEEKGGERG
jgi:hypothetical protein